METYVAEAGLIEAAGNLNRMRFSVGAPKGAYPYLNAHHRFAPGYAGAGGARPVTG